MRFSLFILMICALMLSCQEQPPRYYSASAPFLEESYFQVDSLLEHLSDAEKIGQLIIYRNDNQEGFSAQNIAGMAEAGRIGGFWLKDLVLSDYLMLIETETRVPLINLSGESGLLNNLFTDVPGVPGSTALFSYPSDTLKERLITLRQQQAYSLGVNGQVVADSYSRWFAQGKESEYLSLFNQRILGLEQTFGPIFFDHARDTLQRRAMLESLQPKVNEGLCGFYLPKDSITDPSEVGERISDLYQSQLNFDGLLVADASDSTRWNSLLVHGVDLFVVNSNPESLIQFMLTSLRSGQLTKGQLNQRLRKVLQAKYWARSAMMQEAKPEPVPVPSLQASVVPVVEQEPVFRRKIPRIESHLQSESWGMVSRQIYEKSIVVLPDTGFRVPILETQQYTYHAFHYADEPMREFDRTFSRYASLVSHHYPLEKGQGLKAPEITTTEPTVIMLLLDQQMLNALRDTTFLNEVRALANQYHVVVFNFGSPLQLKPFSSRFTIVQLPESNEVTEVMAAQVLFGGIATSGQFPYDINFSFKKGMGIEFPPVRLGYSPSQQVGIAPEKLVGIDAIALNAIDEGVFPGCEVLVAKGGKVIYSKAFGFQTYEETRPVRENHLYDVASLTKITATTLAAMRLYDQEKIKLNDKLKSHLDLDEKSTLRNITIKNLLIHESGLPAYLPVGPYLIYRDQPNAGCDSFFCKNQTEAYNIKVADQFYFKGEYLPKIWKDLQELELSKKKRYRYSDANFVLMQKVIEKEVEQPMNIWLDNNIYRPLGLRYTTFLPLNRFGTAVIAPTQQDERWRHQLVNGYVHDETAALFGGVSGHAGLFSNVGDLAVIGQMLLNEGTYGGLQFIQPATVRLFTSGRHGNHRGLGFDKPSEKYNSAHAPSASARTFGHTGFTGTCLWVDPQEDLVFVFLSNRIYPDIDNKKLFKKEIRERIHEVVYHALDTYHFALPELDIAVPGVAAT